MPRGRPRQFDRDQALDAALELFWRHGYEGTSMAALTKAMDLNAPSIYAAFGNKESLFRAALERYLQRPASYLPVALKAPTARQAIQQLFQGAIDMVMDPRHADGCLLVQGALASGPATQAIQQELARRRMGAEVLVRRRLEQGMAAGELPDQIDSAALAKYFVTLLWGLSVQAAGGATRRQLEQVAAMAMRLWPEDSGDTNNILSDAYKRP